MNNNYLQKKKKNINERKRAKIIDQNLQLEIL